MTAEQRKAKQPLMRNKRRVSRVGNLCFGSVYPPEVGPIVFWQIVKDNIMPDVWGWEADT